MLYAILDSVVDGYAPVVAGLQKDIDEIEIQVFRGDPKVSRRIYELSREVIEFQRATRPLLGMLDGLAAGFDKYGTDEELQRYLRDVADHATTVAERVDGFRQNLSDILTVNATLVNQAQNEEIKRLTEASFDAERGGQADLRLGRHPLRADAHRHDLRHELRQHPRARTGQYGYPFALALMVLTSVVAVADLPGSRLALRGVRRRGDDPGRRLPERGPDLHHQIDEWLLAHLDEAVPRPIQIDDERQDRRQDDDEHDGAQRTAAASETGAVADHAEGEAGSDDQEDDDRLGDAAIDDRGHPRRVHVDHFVHGLDVERKNIGRFGGPSARPSTTARPGSPPSGRSSTQAAPGRWC